MLLKHRIEVCGHNTEQGNHQLKEQFHCVQYWLKNWEFLKTGCNMGLVIQGKGLLRGMLLHIFLLCLCKFYICKVLLSDLHSFCMLLLVICVHLFCLE